MNDQLVEYALNLLDEPDRRRVEARLADDPDYQSRLHLVRQALEPLEADREQPAPPPGLVASTIARVAEHICRPLPKAPPTVSVLSMPERPWWRRVDVLVAAGLLLVVIGLGGPMLVWSHRTRVQTAQCQDNLRVMYSALDGYHQNKGSYPDVAREKHKSAGMVMPILRQSGYLKDKPVICPGAMIVKPAWLPLEELRAMDPETFERHAGDLNPGYAYTLSFRDGDVYYPPTKMKPGMLSTMPLMADCPAGEEEPENSLNHAGGGQNVLFQDGHVKFLKTRHVGYGGDDIFRNKENKVAAGLDMFDSVLGCSRAKP